MTKRYLTDDEIDDILSEIKLYNNLPKEYNTISLKNIKCDLYNKFKDVKVYPSIIPNLKEKITSEYHKSRVSPGECVGVIVGQSLGEKQTQSTLNSFHSAGLTVKTVVTGVPRFTELISASKDPKGIIGKLFLNDDLKTIPDIRNDIGDVLIQVNFKKLVETFTIIEDPKYKTWYKLYSLLFQKNINLQDSFVINIKLNKTIMFKHRIKHDDVKKVIEKKFKDLKLYFSPLNLMELDVIVSHKQKISDIEVYTDNVILPILGDIVVKGVEGIEDYIINTSDYTIETEGVIMDNLSLFPQINFNKSFSNNMWDIYNLMGVEACRQFLVYEFSNVLNSDGTFINYSHIKLLVDRMLYTGIINSVSRHGIKGRISPMARASFEESMDNFVRAGIYGEYEQTKSISSSIMLGKNTRIGTGMSHIMFQTSDNDGIINI